MGLFKSLKGNPPDHNGGDSVPDQHTYQAPPGPPPSHLPETHNSTIDDDFQPPPGPPPSQIPSENPPPYHDWTSIPDTSLLPPPPSLGHKSSKNNATWDDAARAHAFCDRFLPYTPAQPSPAVQQAVRNGDLVLERPREYAGELKPLSARVDGLWSARSRKECGDCVLLSTLVGIGNTQTTLVRLFSSCELTGANLLLVTISPCISQPPTRHSTPSNGRSYISKCVLSVWAVGKTASRSVTVRSRIRAGACLDGNERAWVCTETTEGGL
jgi:hypothetical protein